MRAQLSGIAVSLAAVVAAAGCGSAPARNGVVTDGPVVSAGATATAGSEGVGGTRTVLTPLGLNLRSAPDPAAPRVDTLGQGAEVVELAHTDQHGGWYQVRGRTLTGWITADPTLTAAGRFQAFTASDRGFALLYPQAWSFATTPSGVTLRPQAGGSVLVEVLAVAGAAALPAQGADGYAVTRADSVEVCGTTVVQRVYARGAETSAGAATATTDPSPVAGATPAPAVVASPRVPSGAHLAEIRVPIDATRALDLRASYDRDADLDSFRAIAWSVSFTAPQCLRPAPTPTPDTAPAPT